MKIPSRPKGTRLAVVPPSTSLPDLTFAAVCPRVLTAMSDPAHQEANETARIHHACRRRSRTMQQPANHHLAQLNIGRIRYEIDDPRMADFTNNLALVNGIAERSAGFVWRYIDESGNATDTRPYADPRVIVNFSIWESVDALERFVWQTVHKRFYGRRPDWFEHFEGPSVVLWWVPAGHRPSVEEVVARMEHLKQHGPSDHAFDWQTASAQLWKTARCAPEGQVA